jgi:hypothetical protein
MPAPPSLPDVPGLADLSPPSDEDRAARLGRDVLEEALFSDDMFADDMAAGADEAPAVADAAVETVGDELVAEEPVAEEPVAEESVEAPAEAPLEEASVEADAEKALAAALEEPEEPEEPEPPMVAQTVIDLSPPPAEAPTVIGAAPILVAAGAAAASAATIRPDGRAPTVGEYMERGGEAIEADEPPRRVIREGQFASRRYRMFDNGSLEIDTEQSTIRFATLEEFRAFVAAASRRGPEETRPGA